jgi:hypothetical protein
MKTQFRLVRKSYAMHRMGRAIERAVEARTTKEKERAARWVGAWGLLCGIKTSTVRLRHSDVARDAEDRIYQTSDGIEIFSAVSKVPGHIADTGARLPSEASQQPPLSVEQTGETVASGIVDPADPA